MGIANNTIFHAKTIFYLRLSYTNAGIIEAVTIRSPMKKVKKNLKDLVAASYATHTHNDSPYANLRHKLSPKKLEDYINSLTEDEKEDYLAYC